MDQGVPEGTCSQVLRSTSVDSWRLRASKLPVLKWIEIVILWVYYTIPFGFCLIWHFSGITFQRLNYFVWLRITDKGLLPEIRIWSILLIKSDLKWCIHLSRSLFIFFWCYGAFIILTGSDLFKFLMVIFTLVNQCEFGNSMESMLIILHLLISLKMKTLYAGHVNYCIWEFISVSLSMVQFTSTCLLNVLISMISVAFFCLLHFRLRGRNRICNDRKCN